MAISAYTQEKFGLTSIQEVIDSLVDFLVVQTKTFRLGGSQPNRVVLLATSKVDSQISRVPKTTDMIWAISFTDNGVFPALSDQLCIGWGNVLPDLDPQLSEITLDDPVMEDHQAIMTATQLIRNPGQNIPFAKATRRISATNPHAYRCTVTSRGISMCIYSENDNDSWETAGFFTLQRSVNPDGSQYLDNKAPMFVLWNNLDSAPGEYATIENDGHLRGAGGGFAGGPGDLRWFCSVLRETDIHTSTASATPESYGILPNRSMRPRESKAWDVNQVHFENRATLRGFPTTWDQPILKDDSEIAFIFPYGFTTSRFSYNKELDMIAGCSAQAVSLGQTVDIFAFGEARKYQMMVPSQSIGRKFPKEPLNGFAVGILVDGPEFRS